MAAEIYECPTDFETPEAWWNSVRTSTNPDQHLRILADGGPYSGFTVGNMTNASPTPSAHPRLYAADGHGPGASIPDDLSGVVRFTGELIVRCPHFHIGRSPGLEGEGVMWDLTTERAIQLASAPQFNPTGLVVDSCLMRLDDPDNDSGFLLQFAVTGDSLEATLRNVGIYVTGTLQNSTSEDKSIALAALVDSVSNKSITLNWDHVRIYCDTVPNGSGRIVDRGLFLSPGHATNTINARLRNCIIIGTGFRETVDKSSVGTVDFTGSSHNATSDDRSRTLLGGGSESFINVSASELFTDPETDWTLIEGCEVIDAGIQVLDYDALGEERPQGDGPDLGPLEFVPDDETADDAGLFIEEAIFHRLKTDSRVSAMVSTRVYPHMAPQDAPLPYIVYQRIGGEHTQHMTGVSGKAHARLQIDCHGATYRQAKSLADAVRLRLGGFKGTIADDDGNALFVGFCRLADDSDGFIPPSDASDAGSQWISMEFDIWHNETVPE